MRDFDIILYGATGFTGRQSVQYFQQHAPPGLRWAIAGRDRSRLDRLSAGVPAIVADSSDASTIDALVRRTRIVVSTAGPFELYSDAVVHACVRFGVHYLDITGEVLWVRSLIDRFHELASAAGIRIIPFCGFDSVPADLGAIALARELGPGASIKAYYRFRGGPPNGGTIATGFHVAASGAKDRLRDPFILSPDVRRLPQPLELDPTRPHYDADVRSWVTPFLMGPINTRVVRRSCALLGLDASYQEFAQSAGAVQAHLSTAVAGLLNRALYSAPIREALRSISPKPGTGPTEQSMDAGSFHCEFVARAADGRTARASISAPGDPANRVTVMCLCESALALACDSGRLPACAGVLTPSTGLGPALRVRLAAGGMRFLDGDSVASNHEPPGPHRPDL
jgi:short subunit dehydrogenase-like uncharacterized protein